MRPSPKRRWRQALLHLAAAASVLVWGATATLWLAHLLRDQFYLSVIYDPVVLGDDLTFWVGGETDATPYAGYSWSLDRPRPFVDGPELGTPAHAAWDKQIHRHDWSIDFADFYVYRWALVWQPAGKSVFKSDEYGAEVPFWFVCAATTPLPLWWLRRRVRGRRRLAEGLCAGCGYDLRASSDRCPECGRPAAAGDGEQALSEEPRHGVS